MPIPLTAPEVLDREFLEIRARILQIAASLDRLGRAEGEVSADARHQKLQRALALLQSPEPDRAEQIQMLFSRTYDKNWLDNLGVKERR
jgi:hypothetical protein